MDGYTRDELEKALEIIASTIRRCEKMQLKFAEGSSQHTLLINRIKALYIAKSLITGEKVTDQYTKEELTEALWPVSSIISKCQKAQQKFAEATYHYIRLNNLITAMGISKTLITNEISQRG